PRDAEGKVIGFAVTKDSPDAVDDRLSPLTVPGSRAKEARPDAAAAVGGGGLDAGGAPEDGEPAEQEGGALRPVIVPRLPDLDDDLYFDDGIIDSDDGGRGAVFDESIFDAEDTDMYGRPLPGVFASLRIQMDARNNAEK